MILESFGQQEFWLLKNQWLKHGFFEILGIQIT
jgi:hypothetical protein